MPKGFKSLKRKVRRMERNLGDNVADAAHTQAQNVAADSRANVLTGGQIWTGNLAASIYARSVDGPGIDRIVIKADTPYAAFVEYGVGPKGAMTDPYPGHVQYKTAGLIDGNPPPALVRNITAWVLTKPSFIGPFGPMDRNQVAWAIAKNIARVGTNAHPYMRPAWFQNEIQLRRAVQTAVRRTVRNS